LENSSWSNAEGWKILRFRLKTDRRALHVRAMAVGPAIIKDGHLEAREADSHDVFQPLSTADRKQVEFGSLAEFGQFGLVDVLKPSIIRESPQLIRSLLVSPATIENQNE